jgi:hypothetical protein
MKSIGKKHDLQYLPTLEGAGLMSLAGTPGDGSM